jgi:hypothetical protein
MNYPEWNFAYLVCVCHEHQIGWVEHQFRGLCLELMHFLLVQDCETLRLGEEVEIGEASNELHARTMDIYYILHCYR